MSRSAPGPFSLRPLRISSLRAGEPEGRPIQPTPDDGPPSGHPHLGGRPAATYEPMPDFRAMPIEQRTQYAIRRPSAPAEASSSSQASLPPLPPLPEAELTQDDEVPTAEQDPFDAPPAQAPASTHSSIYGGVVDDAANPTPAPPEPVLSQVVATRPPTALSVSSPQAATSGSPADIEIEVRGRAGNRTITIRLRS